MRGRQGCTWMCGILGEAVCEEEHCKCSTESAIVVRKAKRKHRNALRNAKFLGRQYARESRTSAGPREQLLHERQRGSNVVRYEAQNP